VITDKASYEALGALA